VTVIDAGVVVKLLTRDVDLAPAERPLSAPHLIDSEVTHVLRRLVASGRLSPRQGDAALDGFRQLIIRRRPVTHLLDRMWELRHNVSGYDATYVALAETLDVPLVTTDRRLAGAPGIRCEVEIIYPVE
jgi:predicted nucleic acid-binding protein